MVVALIEFLLARQGFKYVLYYIYYIIFILLYYIISVLRLYRFYVFVSVGWTAVVVCVHVPAVFPLVQGTFLPSS